MTNQKQVTELLLSLRDGNRAAVNELVPLVYNELRRIARNKLRLERRDHTLGTTALAMRHILVGHARRRKRVKRGGGALHDSLSEVDELPAREADRILDLDDALHQLAALNPRQARIVECRFFGGMTIEETAEVLGVSTATAKRDWTVLRGWLQRELNREP